MRPADVEMAEERMAILVDAAISRARTDPVAAQRLAGMARRISSRYRVRMPYEMRMHYCKKCKSFMAPGSGSRIRIGRASVRAIRITCSRCAHTYRKIIPQ